MIIRIIRVKKTLYCMSYMHESIMFGHEMAMSYDRGYGSVVTVKTTVFGFKSVKKVIFGHI